ncbi:MAG: hypothetical protein ACM33T_14440 [Solirubrobacterales bacterium]
MRPVVIAAAALLAAQPALAQEEPGIVTGSRLGDVLLSPAPGRGELHLAGGLAVASADYRRGAFDGVRQWDGPVYGIDLQAVGPVLRRPHGSLDQVTLTLGSANALADTPMPGTGWWYRSDEFITLAAALADGTLLGLTHTYRVSPNGEMDTQQETAAAIRYTGSGPVGRFRPQAKLAFREEGGNGAYAELSVAPQTRLDVLGRDVPLTFTIPLAVGIGFDDYYGRNSGTAAYGDGGIEAAWRLTPPESHLGAWSMTAAVHVILREGDIANASRFDDNDHFVGVASLGLRMAY